MRPYELMVILDSKIDERTITPSFDKLFEQVKTAGGTVEKIDVWGKRKLAYEIAHHGEGIYVVAELTTTPDVANEVNRQLGLNESVLRTKLLRRDLSH